MAYINFRLGDSRPKAFAAFIETLPKSETGWETLAHSRCPSSTSTLILLSPLKGPDDPLKAHLKRVNALPSGSAVKSYAQFITFCIGYITLKERRLSNDEVDQVLQSVLGKDLSQDRLRKRRNGAKFLAHVIDSLLPRFRDLAPLLFFWEDLDAVIAWLGDKDESGQDMLLKHIAELKPPRHRYACPSLDPSSLISHITGWSTRKVAQILQTSVSADVARADMVLVPKAADLTITGTRCWELPHAGSLDPRTMSSFVHEGKTDV